MAGKAAFLDVRHPCLLPRRWARSGAGLVLALAVFAAHRAPLAGAAAPPAGVEFFEKKIRPVLAGHCYKGHSARAGRVKGGLVLDTRAGVRKGGASGPAVVPGRPGTSLLLKAVRYADAPRMPPKG